MTYILCCIIVPASFDDIKTSKTSSATIEDTDKKNESKKGGVKLRGRTNISDGSSDYSTQGSHSTTEERNYAKSIAIAIDSDDERIESSSASQPKGRHDDANENIGSSVNKGKPQSLDSNLSNMSLDVRSGNPNNVNARKATSNKQYKPEKWMLYNEAEDTLIQLNLAIVSKTVLVILMIH